jgi:GxxExxY protein
LPLRLCAFAGESFVQNNPTQLFGGILMTENQIATIIVDASLKVHRALGPGLLESVYVATLAFELEKRGLSVIKQQAIPVVYEEVKLEIGFRADLIVNNKVIIEIKSVDALAPVHRKQLETYLRITGLHLGLLINFNVELIKDGIQRVVNRLPE